MSASALLLAARVASINLCTDEYLLLLGKPQEIVSVSYLSQDSLESPLWRQARRHHGNHGSVEQVLKTRPTLVLNMGGGGRASSLIASRLKMRSLDLPAPDSIDGVAANLKTVATALGDPRRAVPWLSRLAKLRRSRPVRAADAILLTGGGRSLQRGSPAIDWLRLAGLQQRPLPEGRASLETLLTRPPAVLVESRYRRKQVSSGTAWLDHPVVRKVKARRLETDGRAWTCLGPLMIPEIERLRRTAR
jgi:iron complex transport system substrate-binding protein